MHAAGIHIGEVYLAKVSGQFAAVKILSQRIDSFTDRRYWVGRNEKTGREITIRSAQRLRRNLTIERAFRADGDLSNLGRSVGRDDWESIELARRILGLTRAI